MALPKDQQPSQVGTYEKILTIANRIMLSLIHIYLQIDMLGQGYLVPFVLRHARSP